MHYLALLGAVPSGFRSLVPRLDVIHRIEGLTE